MASKSPEFSARTFILDSLLRAYRILHPMLTIGRFADATGLTVRALRHYERIDLLRPAHVDPDTGYRYYDAAQVEDAVAIRRLRALEMPLDEIRQLLAADAATFATAWRRTATGSVAKRTTSRCSCWSGRRSSRPATFRWSSSCARSRNCASPRSSGSCTRTRLAQASRRWPEQCAPGCGTRARNPSGRRPRSTAAATGMTGTW